MNLKDSSRGNQSAAESCAKHLKDQIERDGKLSTRAAVVAPQPTPRRASVSDAPSPASPVAADSVRTITTIVQGDWAEQDFLCHLREAFATYGIELDIVKPESAYDYNIIVTNDSADAISSAVVLG